MVVSWRDGALFLSGEFDLANQCLVYDAVAAAVGHGWPTLTIDMSEVDFCDASSMAPLVNAAEILEDVIIRNPSPAALKVLNLTRVVELVTIED